MFGFQVTQCKPQLKMAMHRINLIKNKIENQNKMKRKEIAQLLDDKKEEKARIKVEAIIRDDYLVEGYEILELLCEHVSERMNLIHRQKNCPEDMKESICTLIWSTTRTEIPELAQVKKQFLKKYGQELVAVAEQNLHGCVNERVVQKLGVEPPSAYLVINYMKEIAKQYKVQWEPECDDIVNPLAPIPGPTGTSIAAGGASGPNFAAVFASKPLPTRLPSYVLRSPDPAKIVTDGMNTTSEVSKSIQHQWRVHKPDDRDAQAQTDIAPIPDTVPDFDELTARFERLRSQTRSDSIASASSFTF